MEEDDPTVIIIIILMICIMIGGGLGFAYQKGYIGGDDDAVDVVSNDACSEYTCPTGYTADPNATDTLCSSSTCTIADKDTCCNSDTTSDTTVNAACSTYDCPGPLWTQKTSADTTPCSTSSCGEADNVTCCTRVTDACTIDADCGDGQSCTGSVCVDSTVSGSTSCISPTITATDGYIVNSENLTMSGFSVDLECNTRTGYTGTVTGTVCSTEGTEYNVDNQCTLTDCIIPDSIRNNPKLDFTGPQVGSTNMASFDLEIPCDDGRQTINSIYYIDSNQNTRSPLSSMLDSAFIKKCNVAGEEIIVDHSSGNSCDLCSSGYHPEGGSCVINHCDCNHGTAVVDGPLCTTHDTNICSDCTTNGYILGADGSCEFDDAAYPECMANHFINNQNAPKSNFFNSDVEACVTLNTNSNTALSQVTGLECMSGWENPPIVTTDMSVSAFNSDGTQTCIPSNTRVASLTQWNTCAGLDSGSCTADCPLNTNGIKNLLCTKYIENGGLDCSTNVQQGSCRDTGGIPIPNATGTGCECSACSQHHVISNDKRSCAPGDCSLTGEPLIQELITTKLSGSSFPLEWNIQNIALGSGIDAAALQGQNSSIDITCNTDYSYQSTGLPNGTIPLVCDGTGVDIYDKPGSIQSVEDFCTAEHSCSALCLSSGDGSILGVGNCVLGDVTGTNQELQTLTSSAAAATNYTECMDVHQTAEWTAPPQGGDTTHGQTDQILCSAADGTTQPVNRGPCESCPPNYHIGVTGQTIRVPDNKVCSDGLRTDPNGLCNGDTEILGMCYPNYCYCNGGDAISGDNPLCESYTESCGAGTCESGRYQTTPKICMGQNSMPVVMDNTGADMTADTCRAAGHSWQDISSDTGAIICASCSDIIINKNNMDVSALTCDTSGALAGTTCNSGADFENDASGNQLQGELMQCVAPRISSTPDFPSCTKNTSECEVVAGVVVTLDDTRNRFWGSHLTKPSGIGAVVTSMPTPQDVVAGHITYRIFVDISNSPTIDDVAFLHHIELPPAWQYPNSPNLISADDPGDSSLFDTWAEEEKLTADELQTARAQPPVPTESNAMLKMEYDSFITIGTPEVLIALDPTNQMALVTQMASSGGPPPDTPLDEYGESPATALPLFSTGFDISQWTATQGINSPATRTSGWTSPWTYMMVEGARTHKNIGRSAGSAGFGWQFKGDSHTNNWPRYRTYKAATGGSSGKILLAQLTLPITHGDIVFSATVGGMLTGAPARAGPSWENNISITIPSCSGECFANIGESCGKQNDNKNDNKKNLLNMNNTHKKLLFVLLIIVIFFLFKDKK